MVQRLFAQQLSALFGSGLLGGSQRISGQSDPPLDRQHDRRLRIRRNWVLLHVHFFVALGLFR